MKKLLGIAACAFMTAAMLQSCSTEEPFADGGEGLLKLKMVVNSDVTRAETDEAALADNCVIYISSSKGLIYKYKGLDEVPSDLYLKEGGYVAEAWTGDSVSASFDKKFYKAYEPFTITKGVNNVLLNCKIANVVASINPDELLDAALQNYVVTIGNSRASLEYNAENATTAHGYYMMPDGENSLNWSIVGLRENGEEFTKSGTIENVKPAHEYTLNIRFNPDSSEIGGGFIVVTVDDSELLIEDTIQINAAPKIVGMGYDLDSPIVAQKAEFERKSVYISACGHLQNVRIETDDYAALGLPRNMFDFIEMNDAGRAEILAAGLGCEIVYNDEQDVEMAQLSFAPEMLNRLENGSYAIKITATDDSGKSRTKTLTINVSDAAVVLKESEWYEIRSRRAIVHGVVAKDGQTSPGIRYRKVGDSSWTVVNVDDLPAGSTFDITLTGLQPATRYEYQAVVAGYENTNSMYFNTEPMFTLPNAGFENWSTDTGYKNDKAVIPTSANAPDFWDTGNHGSMKMNKTVTDKATSPLHGGSYSACLKSQFVGLGGSIGKFAAGNIFSGIYIDTEGLSDGILSFGREYDGSRPDKFSGWVYYHPGAVTHSSVSQLPVGATDQGQIYVALTTEKVEIRTKGPVLLNPDADYIVAYGQMTFTSDYGSASEMRKIEIPFEYKKTDVKPKYIIIVGSASKFGDYFSGSTESVMYLDDFELIYE